MAEKDCRKFQSPEEGARTLQRDRQTDDRHEDGRAMTYSEREH